MSDIRIIKESLSKNTNLKVIFAAELNLVDSKGREIKRTVYASGSDDQFFTDPEHLNIMLCDTDKSLDLYQRFDALESAFKRLVEHQTPELLLEQLMEVRNNMLPLSAPNNPSILLGDSAEDVLKFVDLSKYNPHSYKIEPEENIKIDASIDISYDKEDRYSLRLQAERIKALTKSQYGNNLIIWFDDAIDNYDVILRINAFELMADKLYQTRTKAGKLHSKTLQMTKKLIEKNQVLAK